MAPYAIIRAAGKQYRVCPGARLVLDRVASDVGQDITFAEVLLLGGEGTAQLGFPLIDGAKVTARVKGHLRGDKIRVFKRRKRKGFHKTIGHRQELSELEITSIAG